MTPFAEHFAENFTLCPGLEEEGLGYLLAHTYWCTYRI